jgi:hypothetical protein
MFAIPKTLPSAELTHTLYTPASTSCNVPNILHPTQTGAGGTGMRGTSALNASAPTRLTFFRAVLVPSKDAAGQAVGNVAVFGGRLYTWFADMAFKIRPSVAVLLRNSRLALNECMQEERKMFIARSTRMGESKVENKACINEPAPQKRGPRCQLCIGSGKPVCHGPAA